MAEKKSDAAKAEEKAEETQTFCSRCGEPCGNAEVCATCLAR